MVHEIAGAGRWGHLEVPSFVLLEAVKQVFVLRPQVFSVLGI